MLSADLAKNGASRFRGKRTASRQVSMPHSCKMSWTSGGGDAAHHRQFDDIGTGFEVSEGEGARHGAGYGRRPATLKQSSSDRTLALDVEREIVESLLGQ